MAARRKRPQRGGRRGSHRGVEAQFDWKVVAIACAAVALLGGAGYFIAADAGKVQVAANGSYPSDARRAHTVALIDSSSPRFDAAQTRDLHQRFSQLYAHELAFNEKLTLITTERDWIGSVPKPRMAFCRGARRGEELEAIGAVSATSAYLANEAEKFRTLTYEPVLAEVFNPNPPPGHRQEAESPIMEQIQSISRMREFAEGSAKRRLIVVSDFIQHTEEVGFCSRKGDLPSFAAFRQSGYFERIQPNALDGVEVRLLMLVRPGYGNGVFAYCSEDELHNFWKAFFLYAGAASVRIDRLRMARGDG